MLTLTTSDYTDSEFCSSNDFWLQYLATSCTKWSWKGLASLSGAAWLLLISVFKSLGQWVKLNFLPSHLVSRKKLWLEDTITFIQQSRVSVWFSINYKSPLWAMDLSNYICEHLIAFFSMFLAVALCILLL